MEIHPHHVIPLNDLKEHDIHKECWCVPTLDDEVWIYTSLDGREFLDQMDLQCGEIPSFLAQVSQYFLLSDYIELPHNVTKNILLALQWLNKRAAILKQNPLLKDAKAIALYSFFDAFISFE